MPNTALGLEAVEITGTDSANSCNAQRAIKK
jgi:hypothetical protein